MTDKTEQNLSCVQKELMCWHTQLCVTVYNVQQIMKFKNIFNQKGIIIASVLRLSQPTSSLQLISRGINIQCLLLTSWPLLRPGRLILWLRCLLLTRREPYLVINMSHGIILLQTSLLSRPLPVLSRVVVGKQHTFFNRGTILQESASNLVRIQSQVFLGAGEAVIDNSSLRTWFEIWPEYWSRTNILTLAVSF